MSAKTPNDAAIIMAAGLGTRMRSGLPKVLHHVSGLPLIGHVVRQAQKLALDPIVVVVGPKTEAPIKEMLAHHFADAPIVLALQPEALGTGDAVRWGLTQVPIDAPRVLILSGDVPLLTNETLLALKALSDKAALALLSAKVDDPSGYGRIVRNGQNEVEAIVEQKDATPAQRMICEINAGVYWGSTKIIRNGVTNLNSNNAQHEFYLTDLVAVAKDQGGAVAHTVVDVNEIQGVNTRRDLSRVQSALKQRIIAYHQDNGVTFESVDSVVVDMDVTLAQDVTIGPGVQLRGQTHLGDHVIVEGPSVIVDTTIGTTSRIKSFCHLEKARVGQGVTIGPFARLRPEATLDDEAHVGNFVEIKKARLKRGAKANHLAYIGDAIIGERANIGAGTITCNYDGTHKHRTDIGNDVFVGSNSTLVAPLEIGDHAFVAAGSVITKAVAKDALALARSQQVNKEGYAEVLRQRIKAKKKAP